MNLKKSLVVATDGVTCAHYEYAPFGAVLVMRGVEAQSNPWRFSSEYVEDETATVYYNYRHYNPQQERWLRRDPIAERGGPCPYAFSNRMLFDYLGLEEVTISCFADTGDWLANWPLALAWRYHSVGNDIVFSSIEVLTNNIAVMVGKCDCIKNLQITAHGASDRAEEANGDRDQVAIQMGNEYLFEDESIRQISGFFGGLKAKFCKKCEITLYSCYLGQSPWLEDRIRKETGCTVKLFKWSVNPLFGTDAINRVLHEQPQLPRVPTVGMPGLLPTCF